MAFCSTASFFFVVAWIMDGMPCMFAFFIAHRTHAKLEMIRTFNVEYFLLCFLSNARQTFPAALKQASLSFVKFPVFKTQRVSTHGTCGWIVGFDLVS